MAKKRGESLLEKIMRTERYLLFDLYPRYRQASNSGDLIQQQSIDQELDQYLGSWTGRIARYRGRLGQLYAQRDAETMDLGAAIARFERYLIARQSKLAPIDFDFFLGSDEATGLLGQLYARRDAEVRVTETLNGLECEAGKPGEVTERAKRKARARDKSAAAESAKAEPWRGQHIGPRGGKKSRAA